MPTLYEVLGVPKTADKEAVKKAYRKRSRETHPDRNPGDPSARERFALVLRAYEILSDDARRAKYDATGDDSERAPDNTFSGVVNLLTKVLANVLQQVIDQGGEVERQDMVAHMRQVLAHEREEMKKAQAGAMKMKKGYEKCLKRFKGRAEMKTLVEFSLRNVGNQLNMIDKGLELNAAAVDFLKGVTFDQIKEAWATVKWGTVTGSW